MATGTAVDVVMPQMGVSVSEGTITKWLKSEGEEIAADEALLEISTDKVDTEVPSPAGGVVTQILVQEGETVEVGARLAVISPEGGGEAEAPVEVPEPATAQAATESSDSGGAEGETATAEQAPAADPAAARAKPAADRPAGCPEPAPAPEADAENGGGEGRAFVSPVVARIASEHGVDVSKIDGSGRGGRVTKKDILAYVESGGAEEEAAAPAAPEAPRPSRPPAEPQQPAAACRRRLRRLRLLPRPSRRRASSSSR